VPTLLSERGALSGHGEDREFRDLYSRTSGDTPGRNILAAIHVAPDEQLGRWVVEGLFIPSRARAADPRVVNDALPAYCEDRPAVAWRLGGCQKSRKEQTWRDMKLWIWTPHRPHRAR
jgi:hypothetical protein